MMKLHLFFILCAASLLALASCRDHLTGPNPMPTFSDTIAYYPHILVDGKDVTGHGHDGTWPPSFPAQVTGTDRFGKIQLTGEYITVSNTAGLNFTSKDSYTVSAWCKLFGGSGTFPLVSLPTGCVVEVWQSGALNPTFGTNLIHFDSLGNTEDSASGYLGYSDTVSAWSWHMITVVVNPQENYPNGLHIYIDSQLVGVGSAGTMAPSPKSYFPMYLGNYNFLIDDVIITNSASSASWVANRFHEGGWDEHSDTVVNPTQTGWVAGNFGTTQSILGMCFPNYYGVGSNGQTVGWTAFACGANGTLLRSIDSGKTWHSQVSGTGEDLYRVSAIMKYNSQAQQDQITAVAAGNNGTVLRTTDGTNWTTVSNIPFQTVNGSLENIRDIKFLDATHVMMVGGAGNTQTSQADGFVMMSADAGATWTRMKTTGMPLYSIGVSSPQLVTVVGSKGQIYSTTDFGGTWNDESVNDAGDDFLAVAYSPIANSTAGMASTAYGTLYNTSNGGSYWGAPGQSGVSSALRTVTALNVGEWWIAGDNGVILHTMNDGINWTRYDINGVSVQWNEIVARDPNMIAFVGANGTLYWFKE